MSFKITAFLFFAFLFSNNLYATEASSKNTTEIKYKNIDSNVLGKAKTDIDNFLKSLKKNETVQNNCPGKAMQTACKAKFGEYCACYFFSESNPDKPLEARAFYIGTKGMGDDKVVELQSSYEGAMPSHVWFEPKEKTKFMRLHTFTNGEKPEYIVFSSALSSFDKGGPQMNNLGISEFAAIWERKDGTNIAVLMWCPVKGKPTNIVGKVRDCFVNSIVFTSIRKFEFDNLKNKNFNY